MAYVNGCVVKITKNDDDSSCYTVHQEITETGLPKPLTEQKRFEIKDEFGPAEMIGYVDRDTYDAGIVLFVAGIQIGPFYGNLEESGEEIRINLELRAVTGHVVLCLSDDNEVYTRYSLTVKLGGVWDGQHKLSDTL